MILYIEYLNETSGEITNRKINIYGVTQTKNDLIINSYCFLREESRTFKMNNLIKVNLENGKEILNLLDFFQNNFIIKKQSLIERDDSPEVDLKYDFLPNTSIQNYTICLTGASSKKMKKKDFYLFLEGVGAKTTDTYNKTINLLIVLGESDLTSSKLKKCMKRRNSGEEILIIHEDYFWEYINRSLVA